jgi:predicted nucleotidyltransferase
MNRVKEHYEHLVKYLCGDTDCIFGVFLAGSQNYNLDTADSDVDTKAVIFPTFDDMAQNRMPVSTTLFLPVEGKDPEHMTVVDFRLWVQQLQKGNVNTLETLFTDYFVINPKYEFILNELHVYREDFAHMDSPRVVQATMGIVYNGIKYTFRQTEHTEEVFKKYGYNPKELMTAVRAYNFVADYLAGASFATCLDNTYRRNWLLELKNGKLSYDEAKNLTNRILNEIEDTKNWLIKNSNLYYDEDRHCEIRNRLMRITYDAVREAVKEDFK